MQPLKTTCKACGFKYFWAGDRTDAPTTCRNCRAACPETVLHHDSPAAQLLVEYRLRVRAEAERLQASPPLADDLDPRYADGHPPDRAAA